MWVHQVFGAYMKLLFLSEGPDFKKMPTKKNGRTEHPSVWTGQGTSSAQRSSSSSLSHPGNEGWEILRRQYQCFWNCSWLTFPSFLQCRRSILFKEPCACKWKIINDNPAVHRHLNMNLKISSVKLICITGYYQPWIWLHGAYVPPLLLNAGLPGPQVSWVDTALVFGAKVGLVAYCIILCRKYPYNYIVNT